MHEIGLLAPVVRAAAQALHDTGGSAVKVVALRVGARAGATLVALDGAWSFAIAGSVVEGAQLVLEEVPAAVWCPACEAEREIDANFAWRCPVCATPTGDLVRGREFEVAYVELEVPEHA